MEHQNYIWDNKTKTKCGKIINQEKKFFQQQLKNLLDIGMFIRLTKFISSSPTPINYVHEHLRNEAH